MLPPVLPVLGTVFASAQDYPSRPIRIVAAAAGGAADFSARLLAQGLLSALEQPVIVENRPNGPIPYTIVAKASPDGYSLLIAAGNLWLGPFLGQVPYDPVRDFSPITTLTLSPLLLVVHPTLPVTSVKELIASAKAKPGELNYAATGAASPSRLAPELFKAMAGIDMLYVPYKAVTQGLNDVIGGRVHLMFPVAAAAIPLVKSGKLKALAVTSAQSSSLVPGLPTIASSGLPGYEAVQLQGIFAPARTPTRIINRLNEEIVRFQNRPDVKEKFFNTGAEVLNSSPEQFAATIKGDMARMGKVIKDAGIRGE
jgi:tripartite-type tricarboxylate transporter receptor subunit TctC